MRKEINSATFFSIMFDETDIWKIYKRYFGFSNVRADRIFNISCSTVINDFELQINK